MCYHRTIIPVILGMLTMTLLCTGCLASEEAPEVAYSEMASPGLTWLTTPMTDAATGERFTIKDLAELGKPVVLHSFAVWCPGCSMPLESTRSCRLHTPDRYIVLHWMSSNDNAAKVNGTGTNKFRGYLPRLLLM